MSGYLLKMGGANLEGLERKRDDFYATPREAIAVLCEEIVIPDHVWEPCCGDGAIAKYLEEQGHTVESSDLVDRGHGKPRIDFLMEWQSPCKAIVTNPPWNLAGQFAKKAFELRMDFLAMLVKVDFFSAKRNYDLWLKWQPSHILPLTWRPDFTGGGGSPLNCMWVVWSESDTLQTKYRPLPKPRLI